MRILVVDDDLRVEPGAPLWGMLDRLRVKHKGTKVFVSRRAACDTEAFDKAADLPINPNGLRFKTGTRSALEAFLGTIDILVLDLGGLGGLQEGDQLTKKKITD